MLEVDRLLASSADQRRALEELAERTRVILERIRAVCAGPESRVEGPAIINAPPRAEAGRPDDGEGGRKSMETRSMAAGRRSRKN